AAEAEPHARACEHPARLGDRGAETGRIAASRIGTAQGRVHLDPGPRAAQPPGRDAERSRPAEPAEARRAHAALGERAAAPAAEASDAADRRPARRLPRVERPRATQT